MKKYELVPKRRVRTDLKKVSPDKQDLIIKAIESLAEDPFRPGKKIKPIRGASKTFRYRVGDYRIFYEVSQGKVTILAVLHRRDLAKFY